MARARPILDTRKASKSSVTGLFPIAITVFHRKPRIIRFTLRFRQSMGREQSSVEKIRQRKAMS